MTQHSSWDFGFESLNAIYTLFSFFICVLLLALRFVKHCFFLLFFLCFCRNWSQLIQRAGGETCLCWDTLNTSWFVHLTSRLFWKTELEERMWFASDSLQCCRSVCEEMFLCTVTDGELRANEWNIFILYAKGNLFEFIQLSFQDETLLQIEILWVTINNTFIVKIWVWVKH